MEIDFNPNIRLQSTFYDVPGYKSRLHVLTSPIPPFPHSHAVSGASDAFERETILQAEAYHGRLPVVLVHGMVVASSYMHDLGRQLAPWLRVFIPDLPGFGRSSGALGKRDAVSISQLAQGLHDWMDSAGIRTAHFVSNSLGCQILAEFTRRWPDRVGRLVLQGPTMDSSRQPLSKTVLAMVANSKNEPLSMGAIMLRDYWSAGWRRALALFREAAEYRIVDALEAVEKPTLLLSAELDPVAPCNWVAELSDSMPNAAHYVLTKAAHTANYSASEKMSRIVLRHLLVQDDDGMRRAGREILEQVTEINQTREAAAKQRSRLLWRQLAFGTLVVLLVSSTSKGLLGRWPFIWALLSIESIEVYRYHTAIRPLLSLDRSNHLDRVYVKLQGIADFDSASCMLRAIGRHLHFRDFPQLGVPTSMAAAMPLVNWLPSSLRQTVYSAVGATEAAGDISSTFDAEKITKQVVAHFPAHRKYTAVAIGSSNGALTHLYAAMGIPWLPQTLLMPVKRPKKASIRHGQVDMTAEMEWGRTAAREMLERNPEIELYHMADPNQDQLMIRRMAYFRLKLIKLTDAYRSYLLDALEANGTIIIVRCGSKWPSTKVTDRHYFQSGAVGGATPEEFLQGSADVARFIESQKSPLTKMGETVMGKERRTDWRAPPSSGEVPEAEWGYAEGLTDNIVAFASDHGFQVKYLDYDQPEDASPLVADLYRQRNEQLRRPTDSILVESFVLLEPWLAMRYNLSPFWTVFPVKPSLERLQEYLRMCQGAGKAFRDGFVFLFCSGVDSVGFAGLDRWKGLLDSHFASQDTENKKPARVRLVGTDEKVFPKDFGFPARYQGELAKAVGPEAQYVMPPAFSFAEFEGYMTRNGGRYGVAYRA
jgi:pimeloyl-ACP methyl ester carboxylesterase